MLNRILTSQFCSEVRHEAVKAITFPHVETSCQHAVSDHGTLIKIFMRWYQQGNRDKKQGWFEACAIDDKMTVNVDAGKNV